MGALYDFLERNGQVYLKEHFIYASWLHGDGYVNNRILDEERFANELCRFSYRLLVRAIKRGGLNLEKPILIVGVKTLGASIAKVAAGAFNQKHGGRIRFAIIDYVKNSDGTKSYFWGTSNPSITHLCTSETQVIWMDDLLNLSSTLGGTRAVFEHWSPIAVAAVLFDRSEFDAGNIDVPVLVSLEKHPMKAHTPEACPMCDTKQPIVADFGRGPEYQEQHPDYPGGYKKIKKAA